MQNLILVLRHFCFFDLCRKTGFIRDAENTNSVSGGARLEPF